MIKSIGFVKNLDELYVYKWVKDHVITFLIFYVDNILLMGNDIGRMNEVKIGYPKPFQ